MNTCFYTETLPERQCFFNSRITINTNVDTLDTALCEASALVTKMVSNKVGKITLGNNLSFVPANADGTGALTISETVSPFWHIGATNKPLYTEAPISRVSQQVTKNKTIQKHIFDVIEQNPPFPGSETLTTIPVISAGNGMDNFNGGVILPDGRVFFVPSGSQAACIYDPESGVTTTPVNMGYPGIVGSFANAILLPDGKIFCVPRDTIFALSYNLSDDILTTETVAGPYSVSNGFSKGILLPDGTIFHVPFNSTRDRIYNPITGAISSTSLLYSGNEAFIDGVVLYDKYLFLVPYKSPNAVLIDLATLTTRTILTKTFIGGGLFSGGVLLPNGSVLCVPSGTEQAVTYNPDTDDYTVVVYKFPKNNSSQGGTLLPDGRVLIFPDNNNTIKLYDYMTDSVYDTTLLLNTVFDYSSGVLLRSGDVVFIPKNTLSVALFRYYHQSNFSITTLTGFYH